MKVTPKLLMTLALALSSAAVTQACDAHKAPDQKAPSHKAQDRKAPDHKAQDRKAPDKAPDKAPERKAAEAKCPVMGGKVADVTKAQKSTYKGVTYYFCCAGCKPEFDRDPAKYARGRR